MKGVCTWLRTVTDALISALLKQHVSDPGRRRATRADDGVTAVETCQPQGIQSSRPKLPTRCPYSSTCVPCAMKRLPVTPVTLTQLFRQAGTGSLCLVWHCILEWFSENSRLLEDGGIIISTHPRLAGQTGVDCYNFPDLCRPAFGHLQVGTKHRIPTANTPTHLSLRTSVQHGWAVISTIDMNISLDC
jgi:hypothetical protein